MKKIVIYFSFFIFHFSFAQSWQPVGNAIQDTGYNAVTTLATFNGELYAGGCYYNNCPKNNIARWNGLKWDSLTSGAKDTCVLALAAYDSLLFIGGQFWIAGGIPSKGIAQWDGTKWDSVGSGLDAVGGIYSICLYNKEIYAGGQIFKIIQGRTIMGLGKWNGSYWDSLGAGVNGDVWCLAVYKGNLYVGGYFSTAGSISANNIAMWDGTTWHSLGIGVGGNNVNAMAVYNGLLYVGGDFTTAGGMPVNYIATWDGIKWDTVGKGVNGTSPSVYSLATYNGNLYVGGYFNKAEGKPVSNIAKWDGTNWSTVGAGFNSGPGDLGVYTLAVYDSSLYAGGDFTKSGATTVMGIASWRDSVILGENELKVNNINAKLFPNPNTGVFTIAMSGANEKAEISIYNILCEQVYQTMLTKANTQIDLSKETKGIYLYRVVTESGEPVSQGKFIIE